MIDIVINYNGIVNKFIGDGIMVVFGILVFSNIVEEIVMDV